MQVRRPAFVAARPAACDKARMAGGKPRTTLGLDAIRRRVDRLAGRIGAPAICLPTYGTSEDGARPHIEADCGYHYVVVERGVELSRTWTDDIDELLYWVFRAVTSYMAGGYELKHRRSWEDSRRRRFARQVELLEALSPDWGARQAAEQQEILRQYPFVDGGMRFPLWSLRRSPRSRG